MNDKSIGPDVRVYDGAEIHSDRYQTIIFSKCITCVNNV